MWTRRQLLGAAAAVPVGALGFAGVGGPTRMVVIVVDGGWDATFALDPKVGSAHVASPVAVAGTEEVRTYAAIPVQVNDTTRPSVSAFFERHASRVSVINGLWLGGIAHRPNKVRLLTGTRSEGAPDLVTAAGVALGSRTPLGAVDLSGIGFAGRHGDAQARVGNVGQLVTLVDPAAAYTPIAGSAMAFDPAADAAIAAYLKTRAEGCGVPSYRPAVDRAIALRARGTDLGALLGGTDPSALGGLVDRAMDLLDGGYAVAAMLETGLDWDTHTENDRQGEYHETLFGALLGLMDRLETTGRLEDTLVAVVSEVGRTPWVNAELGKDHWPSCSAMLFGGPVAGGRVCGATDDRLDPQPVDLQTGELDAGGELLRYDHLVAGLLEAVDADPGEFLPGIPPFRGFRV